VSTPGILHCRCAGATEFKSADIASRTTLFKLLPRSFATTVRRRYSSRGNRTVRVFVFMNTCYH